MVVCADTMRRFNEDLEWRCLDVLHDELFAADSLIVIDLNLQTPLAHYCTVGQRERVLKDLELWFIGMRNVAPNVSFCINHPDRERFVVEWFGLMIQNKNSEADLIELFVKGFVGLDEGCVGPGCCGKDGDFLAEANLLIGTSCDEQSSQFVRIMKILWKLWNEIILE
jgi:hypothetical protein